jgi:DNA-binding transcriptional LysR family regulator
MGPGNRPLDLAWLEDFLVLAESGNFSRAAQARAIAQPAFSRHIKGLEEWVGVELFDRSAHPAVLTEAGKRLLPAVEDMLQRLLAARTQARQASEQSALSLRFAATHVLSLTFFPRWLGELESRLSMGPIQMVSDSSQACEDLMLQRRVQFVLCHGHAAVAGRLDESGCPMRRLSEDVLMPVSAPGADGQPRHCVEDAKGTPVPVLLYSLESGLGRIMRALMGPALDSPAFAAAFTAHHAVLLKTMALEGRGVAWLPRSLICDEVAQGRLLPAADPGWNVPVDIRLYRPVQPLSVLAEALWAQVEGGMGLLGS